MRALPLNRALQTSKPLANIMWQKDAHRKSIGATITKKIATIHSILSNCLSPPPGQFKSSKIPKCFWVCQVLSKSLYWKQLQFKILYKVFSPNTSNIQQFYRTESLFAGFTHLLPLHWTICLTGPLCKIWVSLGKNREQELFWSETGIGENGYRIMQMILRSRSVFLFNILSLLSSHIDND